MEKKIYSFYSSKLTNGETATTILTDPSSSFQTAEAVATATVAAVAAAEAAEIATTITSKAANNNSENVN